MNIKSNWAIISNGQVTWHYHLNEAFRKAIDLQKNGEEPQLYSRANYEFLIEGEQHENCTT